MENHERRITLDLPFERALSKTLCAMAEARLDVVGLLDVKTYLSSRLHHEFRRYTLVQVMAAQPTFDALHGHLEIGAILPMTIAVFELADGETSVVAAEPFGGLGSRAEWRRAFPTLAETADHMCGQLALALSRLSEGDHHDESRQRGHAERAPCSVEVVR